ncbi:MAG: hypothetical protein M3O67_06335, partial [Bacteroidota bacterium]|nr:hypothetical protein [Bacteroidota bacterium]
ISIILNPRRGSVNPVHFSPLSMQGYSCLIPSGLMCCPEVSGSFSERVIFVSLLFAALREIIAH